MEPYKAKKYPIEYKIDKDLLRLLSETNLKYGEYKTMLHTLEFDARFFLDSVLLNESYKSTQNWIGPRGVGIEGATFIPPAPDEIYELLINLYEYMNDEFVDPILINVALSHVQFETVHAYRAGNGRVGRALIPVQMAMFDDSEPILFLSEILELYKPSYQRNLMECRKGNIIGYLKFFLQCVIDQCNSFIAMLERIKIVYKEDMSKIESIKGNSVYKLMPIIIKQIVFTKKEIVELSGVSSNAVSNIINKLVELGVIVPDSTVMKKGYRYQRIYEIFVGDNNY